MPGVVIEEYSRTFIMTANENSSPARTEIFEERMVQAIEYARSLHDPTIINWVNLKFVWY